MAPPQFPLHSPGSGSGSAKGRGGPPLEPVPGAARADDPGYLASLRTGTQLGQLRMVMVALLVAPALILAIVPVIVREGHSRLGDLSAWIYLPPLLAALATVLIGPRAPRPMPPGEPAQAAGTALVLFRQAILLRFALSEGVILLGLPLSVIARSEMPFVAAFVLGYPLLVWLALPTTGTVERIRARLEAGGADSQLWAALLARAPRPGRS